MRLDKFTLRGQEAIQSAIELAERNQHQQVEPEHVLAVMLEQPEGIVRPILGKLGANGKRAILLVKRGRATVLDTSFYHQMEPQKSTKV